MPEGAAAVDSRCMIVAGVDDSMASDWAVRWAAEQALLRGTDLFLPNAWLIVAGSFPRRSWGGRRLSSVCAGLCRQATCSVAVVHGDFAAHRGGQALVVGVVGSRGRGVFESLTVGSVATAVATASEPPVIVTRSS